MKFKAGDRVEYFKGPTLPIPLLVGLQGTILESGETLSSVRFDMLDDAPRAASPTMLLNCNLREIVPVPATPTCETLQEEIDSYRVHNRRKPVTAVKKPAPNPQTTFYVVYEAPEASEDVDAYSFIDAANYSAVSHHETLQLALDEAIDTIENSNEFDYFVAEVKIVRRVRSIPTTTVETL